MISFENSWILLVLVFIKITQTLGVNSILPLNYLFTLEKQRKDKHIRE